MLKFMQIFTMVLACLEFKFLLLRTSWQNLDLRQDFDAWDNQNYDQ